MDRHPDTLMHSNGFPQGCHPCILKDSAITKSKVGRRVLYAITYWDQRQPWQSHRCREAICVFVRYNSQPPPPPHQCWLVTDTDSLLGFPLSRYTAPISNTLGCCFGRFAKLGWLWGIPFRHVWIKCFKSKSPIVKWPVSLMDLGAEAAFYDGGWKWSHVVFVAMEIIMLPFWDNEACT